MQISNNGQESSILDGYDPLPFDYAKSAKVGKDPLE